MRDIFYYCSNVKLTTYLWVFLFHAAFAVQSSVIYIGGFNQGVAAGNIRDMNYPGIAPKRFAGYRATWGVNTRSLEDQHPYREISERIVQ